MPSEHSSYQPSVTLTHSKFDALKPSHLPESNHRYTSEYSSSTVAAIHISEANKKVVDDMIAEMRARASAKLAQVEVKHTAPVLSSTYVHKEFVPTTTWESTYDKLA